MERSRTGRDGLGQFCFWLHIVVLLFIVAGWALPSRAALLVYLIFLPLVIAQWKLNKGTCILNNTENWLRHRRWRAPEQNVEEGAWLRTLIRNATGVALSQAGMDRISYSVMTTFWVVALVHFLRFQGA